MLLVAKVKRTSGLVKQQHRRFLGECPRDHNALTLTARQRAEHPSGIHRQRQFRNEAGDDVAIVRRLAPECRDIRIAPKHDVVGYRHVIGQHRILRYKSHLPSQFAGAQATYFAAVKLHAARKIN